VNDGEQNIPDRARLSRITKRERPLRRAVRRYCFTEAFLSAILRVMDITLLIGILGACLILIGFIANEFGKLTAKSFGYDFLNLLGSALLVWYSVLLASWPFFLLNIVWALVSLRDVLQGIRKKN
jgi:hypothetical protein